LRLPVKFVFLLPALALCAANAAAAQDAKPSSAFSGRRDPSIPTDPIPPVFLPPSPSSATPARGGSLLRSVLVPAQDIQVSCRAAGVIEKCPVEEGTRVKAGDIILELNSELEQADIYQAKAVLAGAVADLTRAQKDFDRVQSLRKEAINSEKQMDDTRYQLELAKSHQQQADASLQAANIRFKDRTVRSPVNGIFFKKLKFIGEAVERFEVVARVIDDSQLEMVVYCNPNYLGMFRPDNDVSIKLLDGPGKDHTLTGRIRRVDEIIDAKSGTFRVQVTVPPSAEARIGLAASLVVPGEENPGK
jgi:RND family efflux transporter MFP subunit